MTHETSERAGGKAGADITFTDEMRMTAKKDVFLANVNNKHNFINMLSGYLQHSGCQTNHAQGNADLLIVQTAVQSVTTENTVLVGDDTDLIVLFCFYADLNDLFMHSEAKSTTKKNHMWNIKDQLGKYVCVFV